MSETPANLGFRMPAEWAPHARCWMAWPCRAELWGEEIREARLAFAEVASEIAAFEPVTMVARPEDVPEASMRCGAGVDVLPRSLDDSWMRDIGPTFLLDGAGQLAGVDWQFNAWGGKYPPFDQDARIAAEILEHLDVRSFQAPLILEGGSIHVDGEGTCLVTEQCLLNPNRNPSLDRAAIERHLKDYLGVRTIIWLGQGLENDETDGHIDNLACFARPGLVLLHDCTDSDDANYRVSQEARERLAQARDAAGNPIEVVGLPQPKAQFHNGERMPLSYVNFYLANGAVIMPAFDDSADKKAAAILAEVFPDRVVVPVSGTVIATGGGNIHCITQQQPAAAPAGGNED
ncbi:agmatine deiminase [Oceanibacterium hippocampi]|uniref:Putative agmatine deiminase n=1 Tax=Oceanibacterium hippocampi TaxID=745714 RepID=A0A1Y5SM67_9PROT|nr:agmatine deiminase [Oceanibacterium hippocampi]SLN43766.1 Agmatine deiminase [Oceanibacterium hippocampi]